MRIIKSTNGGVIVVEDNHDVMHDNNSSDLALSTSLNDLDFANLNIDDQSIEVKAPPDIIVVDNNDDFIDDKDGIPCDLAYLSYEVLANDDDDDEMSAAVARSHGGDGGGDNLSHPAPCPIGTSCRCVGGRKATKRGKGGGRDGGRTGLSITIKERCFMSDKTLRGKVTLSESSSWSSRCTTLPGTPSRSPRGRISWDDSWSQNFDLAPYMRSKLWSDIEKGIKQHFSKVNTDNKSYLKRTYWSVKPGETRDVENIVSRAPPNVRQSQWDKQIDFWLDPKHAA
nr:hypothetical protein [Tanacetum cinerariifolium]